MIGLVLAGLLVGSVVGQWDPNSDNGQAIVNLFEWKWSDIAEECENFLGPHGFAGVQVSPPNENAVIHQGKKHRPWWERNHPVSYILVTRSGDESDFRDMVDRCNNVGVRIYPDAVINHMSGYERPRSVGTAGSPFDAAAKSYPAVPYTLYDFQDGNCHTESGSIENYDDAEQVRKSNTVGFNDLYQAEEYVRDKIRNYLNHLISIGVAGFRIADAQCMWPGDLQAIIYSLNNLNTSYFEEGSRPFIFLEAIDLGGEPISGDEYIGLGRVTEFKYGKYLGEAFRGEILLKLLVNFGESWGMLYRGKALVFIDNQDNQRGHDAGGDVVLTFRQSRLYKMAVAFMLAHPYGYTRLMSSYYWDQDLVNGQDKNAWMGPPHDGNYNIVSPSFNEDGSCGNGWICEHRWRQIYNMVEFRNVAHGMDMNDWWDNGYNQIAFCRGDRGFIAFNNDDYDLKETLQTCMFAGTYCDVISGSKSDGSCTGKTVTVDGDGRAYIEITTMEDDGVLAIHAHSKL